MPRLPAWPKYAEPPVPAGYGANLRQVSADLWVGGEDAVGTRRWDTVIDLRDTHYDPPSARKGFRVHRWLPAIDGDELSAELLDAAWDAYRARRGPMLVHCHWGASRSPSVAAALLIRGESMELAEALRRVRLQDEEGRPYFEWPRSLTLASAVSWAEGW